MANLADRRVAAKWMPVMLIGGLVAALAAALLLFFAGRAQRQDLDYRAQLSDLAVLAGAMPAQAAAAGRGEAEAFTKLEESSQQLERLLGEIREHDGTEDIVELPGWSAMAESAKQVLAAREARVR